jgi:trans-aconitate 2-methyltransferase
MSAVRRRDWDAETYDRVSLPQQEWALAVIERLALRGDETVVDAGCGTGRVTRLLLERLPRGHVIGVDVSPSMIALAREALGERAELVVCDLLDLELERPVDAVFSNATFHWIRDHERLFARLHAALRPGGRLVAQCGGRGNIAEVVDVGEEVLASDPFAPHFEGWERAWRFAGPEETEELLTAAGFAEVRCWLQAAPTRIARGEARNYQRAVCLDPYLDRLPEELHEPFIDAVCERLADPSRLGYVRLNIDARRPG